MAKLTERLTQKETEERILIVKNYLKMNKITQTELARRLGYDRSTICHWINGKAPVPVSALKMIEHLDK